MYLFGLALDEAGVQRPVFPQSVSFDRSVAGLRGLLDQAGLTGTAARELPGRTARTRRPGGQGRPAGWQASAQW